MAVATPSRDPWVKRLYLPAYAASEAARLAQVHPNTVGNWCFGRPVGDGRREARVLCGRESGSALSYLNLVEVAFVATLRHLGVPLKRIRIAHEFLQKRFEVSHPFATLDLQTDGASVLYEFEHGQAPWLDRLIDAGRHGQVAWVEPIRNRIVQFDYDDRLRLAIRWFPRGKHQPIVIDPQIQFGAPILKDAGVPTFAIRERYQAGESLEEIQEDFDLEPALVRYSLRFEGVSLVRGRG